MSPPPEPPPLRPLIAPDQASLRSQSISVSRYSVGTKGSSGSKRLYSTKEGIRKKDDLRTRLLDAKIREEVQKRKTKERLYRRKLITRQKRVQEELEYLHFPTLAGFYFDGFQEHHFLLNKEWADIFNEVEEIVTKKKETDPTETFQEEVKRNFWPPKLIGGGIYKVFRTRGIYLDCKELLRDPPRRPPEVRELLALTDEVIGDFDAYDDEVAGAAFGAEEAAAEAGAGGGGDTTTKRGKFGATAESMKSELGKFDYYFDEDLGGFFLRQNKNASSVYFDTKYGIWRMKRGTVKYNGDFYFDLIKGKFHLKDRVRGIYEFDPVWHIWKLKKATPPENSKSYLPKDYYFHELHSAWHLRKDVEASTYAFDENGWRFARRIPITGPDDFYFDESGIGEYVLKEPGHGKSYYYDQEYSSWRKLGCENIHCKYRATNYYWSDSDCVFKLKNEARIYYEFDSNNRFYRRKKILKGRHHPGNWKWNINTKKWELKPDNRSNIFAQLLHWRPMRDYEKPWLDSEDYKFISTTDYDIAQKKAGLTEEGGGQKTTGTTEGTTTTTTTSGDKHGTAYGKRAIDLAIKEAAEVEWGDQGFKESPQRIPFDSPAKDLIDFQNEKKLNFESKHTLEEKVIVPGAEPEEEVVDKSIDRKRLRCGNLASLISEKELKAFFFAAISVTKPKFVDPKDHDDYLYIQFPSDHAATAAIKTMNGVDIKGQKIKLSYPRRHQK